MPSSTSPSVTLSGASFPRTAVGAHGFGYVVTWRLAGLTAGTDYSLTVSSAGCTPRTVTLSTAAAAPPPMPMPSISSLVSRNVGWNSAGARVVVDQDGALASTMRIEWRYRLLGSAWQSGGFSGIGPGGVTNGTFGSLLWRSRHEIEASLRYNGNIVDTKSVFIETPAVPESTICLLYTSPSPRDS